MSETNEGANTDRISQVRATVEKKVQKPAGLLPKNTQQLVILGVAVVMVLIMWLTGNTKRATTTTTGTPSSRVQSLDPATVQAFKQSIQQDQAATRQPISQADSGRLAALGLADRIPPGAVLTPDGAPPPTSMVMGATSENRSSESDPVAEDRKKREYLSLFAPNVAFTYRKDHEAERLASLQRARTTSAPAVSQEPFPFNQAEMAKPVPPVQGEFSTETPPPARANRAIPGNDSEAQGKHESQNEPVHSLEGPPPGAFHASYGKPYVLFEGTVLETLLVNRLNGTFSGPVNCLVTNDVYSRDRQHLLIPAGANILGETKKVEALGQQRLAVFFHRIILPDGYSVTLDQFKGLNQSGETALQGKVNNHYFQIFGASIAIGVLGGIAQVGTGNGYTNSAFDQARAGFGSSLATSSMQILDKFLNILPTVTIREGSRVKVYLAGDLFLPDYSQHTTQPDSSPFQR